jgi:hypothetical protein
MAEQSNREEAKGEPDLEAKSAHIPSITISTISTIIDDKSRLSAIHYKNNKMERNVGIACRALL